MNRPPASLLVLVIFFACSQTLAPHSPGAASGQGLVIDAGALGGLRGGLIYDDDDVRALLPGYEVRVFDVTGAESSREFLAYKRGEERIRFVVMANGTPQLALIFGSGPRTRRGAGVGTPYKGLRQRYAALTCARYITKSDSDYAELDAMTCTTETLPRVEFSFDLRDAQFPGRSLPDEAALLNQRVSLITVEFAPR